MKVYLYVGPENIKLDAASSPPGALIRTLDDLRDWLRGSTHKGPQLVAATFIVDVEGMLRLAHRHSEHVACAGGRPVLAAGEIFFSARGDKVQTEEITNQSVGYCPEPESWSAVQLALDKAGIPRPPTFTAIYLFRRCGQCGTTNVIKDDWWFCEVCGYALLHAADSE